jgi:hypothetical protein
MQDPGRGASHTVRNVALRTIGFCRCAHTTASYGDHPQG